MCAVMTNHKKLLLDYGYWFFDVILSSFILRNYSYFNYLCMETNRGMDTGLQKNWLSFKFKKCG